MGLFSRWLKRSKWLKRKQHHAEWIDVVIDIDDTIISSGGPIKVKGLLGSYQLVHGTVEFLVALDMIANVRLSFCSCGRPDRNAALISRVLDEVRKNGHKLKKEVKVFSVKAGRKDLKGLRKGLDLERAILLDDFAKNSVRGQERNLLKVYNKEVLSCDKSSSTMLYKVRRANNLVRALGMILHCFEVSKLDGVTVVEALEKIQWGSDAEHKNYLHHRTNADDLYLLGLSAMRGVDPGFCLAEVEGCNLEPWYWLQNLNRKLFVADVFSHEHNIFT